MFLRNAGGTAADLCRRPHGGCTDKGQLRSLPQDANDSRDDRGGAAALLSGGLLQLALAALSDYSLYGDDVAAHVDRAHGAQRLVGGLHPVKLLDAAAGVWEGVQRGGVKGWGSEAE